MDRTDIFYIETPGKLPKFTPKPPIVYIQKNFLTPAKQQGTDSNNPATKLAKPGKKQPGKPASNRSLGAEINPRFMKASN